jgi:hypothetical protein
MGKAILVDGLRWDAVRQIANRGYLDLEVTLRLGIS